MPDTPEVSQRGSRGLDPNVVVTSAFQPQLKPPERPRYGSIKSPQTATGEDPRSGENDGVPIGGLIRRGLEPVHVQTPFVSRYRDVSAFIYTTPVQLVGENSLRLDLFLQNLGPAIAYIGFDEEVTPENGVELGVKQTAHVDKYRGEVYLVVQAGTADIRAKEGT